MRHFRTALQFLALAHSARAQSGFPVCEICGDGFAIGNIMANFDGVPCSEIREKGINGELRPSECTEVQNSGVFEACECTDLITYSGEAVVVLLNVTTVMSPGTIDEFEADMVQFMKDLFVSTNNWPGMISGWTANLTRQEFLAVTPDTRNRSRRTVASSSRCDPSLRNKRNRRLQLSAPVAPLETRTFITASSTALVPDFPSLLENTLNQNQPEFIALQRSSPGSTVNRAYFQSVLTIEVFGPTEEVTTERVQLFGDDNVDPAVEDADDGGVDLDTRAIAGIAAAVGFVSILIVGILCVVCRDDDENEDVKQNSFADSLQDRNTRSIGGGSSGSSNASRYRTQRLGNPVSSTTKIVSADGRTVTVLSNQEPGPIPEQAPPQHDDDDQGAYAPVFQDEARMDEPEATEEHSYEVDQHAYEDGRSLQQESLVGSSAAGESRNYVTREIEAPPGKLGIVIETTLDGPVVHKINPDSPLDGLVREGDLITAIDDVDCRAMSASAITELMVRTSEKTRHMIIRSAE